jgi:hypothetical protein
MVVIFTLLVFAWPIAAFAALFMFDSPAAGGVPVYMLFYSTMLYGPVYLFSLGLSFALRRAGRQEAAKKAWLLLCGGNVALWILSFVIVLTVCQGQFACR